MTDFEGFELMEINSNLVLQVSVFSIAICENYFLGSQQRFISRFSSRKQAQLHGGAR